MFVSITLKSKNIPTLECKSGVFIYIRIIVRVMGPMYIGSKILSLIGQQILYADF